MEQLQHTGKPSTIKRVINLIKKHKKPILILLITTALLVLLFIFYLVYRWQFNVAPEYRS